MKKLYRYAGRLYRQADYMNAVHQIHQNNRIKDADWEDMQDLLREMGWTVTPTASLDRDDTYFWTNADGSLDSNFHDTTARNAVGEPPYDPAALAETLLGYMDAPKIPKKQPKASWKQVGKPAPWFYGAKSKPPQDPVPGQFYVLSFDLAPKVDREEKFEDDGYRVVLNWMDDGSMWAQVKYAVGLGGVTITNPQGKSRFVDSPEVQEPWGAAWNTGMRRVEDALEKLKFKSAFKQWAGQQQETRKPRKTKMRTLQNTGTCPVCNRNIKLKGGRMVDHGYQVPWGWQGRTQGCFGVGYPPYEKSPKGCEDYLQKALLPTLDRMEAELSVADSKTVLPLRGQKTIKRDEPGWERAMRNYKTNLESSMRRIKRDIQDTQKRIDDWQERPLPGEGR